MEHVIQGSKKQYALVLVLIPEEKWRKDLTFPRNFANNLLSSINQHEKEFVMLNPCCLYCSVEIYSKISPEIAKSSKEYGVETQILFLDDKPSWVSS